MLTRHDTLPSNKDIQRLQALLESADAGSVTLDAEIASVFHPRQNLLKKGGDLFWRKNTDDGPMFEPVPTYTRSLDARLPRESADDIKMSGKHSTRWHASCDGIGSVDAATEALARRSLALELILKSRLTKQGNPASRKTQVRDDRLPPVAAAEAPPAKEDHRDIVIAAMANEIKRISSAPNYTKIDSPDGEIFSTGRHNPHKRVPTSPRSIQAESILLSRLIEVWVREENPSKKSVQDMERTYRRFVEINGDMPADQVRKVHVRELLIRVRDMPRLMPYELKNHTIAFGVEYGRTHPEIPKITPTTVDSHRILLSILFNWAFRRDYMSFNPAAGFAVRDRRPQAQKRLPFHVDELKLLFEGSTLYTGHAGHVRSAPGPDVFRDGKFWMPLLGLFTGARVSELINLWPSDLRRDSGVHYLDISKGGTLTTVKTQTSERAIPVHPELLRIGLVEFFEGKRTNGDKFIFPDLGRETPTGVVAKHWSEKWRRIQTFSGIDHPKKSFHSFRHTFKSACRASGIPEEIHDAFTGHKYHLSARRYGSRIPIKLLAEHMVTLKYPELDLSHLYEDRPDHV